jgi:hypothetical protein
LNKKKRKHEWSQPPTLSTTSPNVALHHHGYEMLLLAMGMGTVTTMSPTATNTFHHLPQRCLAPLWKPVK